MPDEEVLGSFSQPDKISQLLGELSQLTRSYRLMEVCGTHTMALFETGLRPLLFQRGIELLSGPGCPVCVTAQQDLDYAIALGDLPNVTLCSFGDMLRVPGSSHSLEQRRSMGADIRVVYSPLDAVDLADQLPERSVVFLAVGFETTAPGIALAVKTAAARGLKDFLILPLNKTVPPALHALAGRSELKLDGLLLPGHVSVVIGADAYEPLAVNQGVPCAIAGFEPVDILQGIVSLVQQIEHADPRIDNCYSRVVSSTGNRHAQQVMAEVFQPADVEWRGLGVISGSGLDLQHDFQEFDARKLCDSPVVENSQISPCQCGEVLCGVIKPTDCSLFGTACTPESPQGACMVSQEGSCRAWHKYAGAR